MISVSMIVKNEEKVILRSVESWSKVANQIVIVDTGSTDTTIEIAKNLPKVKLIRSKLFDQNTKPEDFSFSKAKNEAISHCDEKWILWADADDFIDDGNADKIKSLDFNENFAYAFSITSGRVTFEHTRLFTKVSGIKFNENYSCHEFLSLGGMQTNRRRDIVIQHLPEKKDRSTRNLVLCKKDHERNPGDSRALFYLANAYRDNRDFVNSNATYEEYLKVSKWPEERFFAKLAIAQNCVRLGNTKLALKWCFRSLEESDRFAEVYCLIGDLYFYEGELSRACEWFRIATTCRIPSDSKLFVAPFCYRDYPKARIKDCLGGVQGVNSFQESLK